MSGIDILFFYIIIILSAIIHEYAHGWAADRLGDPTARYAGRLTLDPRAHIDWWGTIVMPLLLLFFTMGKFVFGYAKPVPFNPYNLRDQKWGPALIAIAGPLSNFLLAFSIAIVLKYLPASYSSLVPLLQITIYANVLLLVFNLVPIPPLDGSKVLFALLPASAYKVKLLLEQYGFVILIFFVFFLFNLISPIIGIFFKFFINL